MRVRTAFLVVCLLVLGANFRVSGHGFMMLPAQRSSAWRYGFGTPENYNDMGLNCGGAGYQWSSDLDGKCGVCGDPHGFPDKPNEDIGGEYVTGTIVGDYESGSNMAVLVKITAYHMGWFEFRLCPLASKDTVVTQACLNKTLLHEAGTGITRFMLEELKTTSTGTEIYSFILELPKYTCDNCVLQWRYNTGNSWGCDSLGCGIGNGKQENFVNCADIRLYSNSATSMSATMSAITSSATQAPTTENPTTQAPTTQAPTTQAPTTEAPTTQAPTTEAPTTQAPTTEAPTTQTPTTEAPTTQAPTTEAPTTQAPTTQAPTTEAPKTEAPTTQAPTTQAPTTEAPKTEAPTTQAPTTQPPTTTVTEAPTTTKSGVNGCNCRSVPPYSATPGMDDWCCSMWAAGFCPSSHCACV